MKKLSWKIITKLATTKNLFDKQLPYLVFGFVCSCGHSKIIVDDGTIDYCCLNCKNNIFLDANFYNQNDTWFKPIEELFEEEFLELLDFDTYIKDEFICYELAIEIPYKIELASEKIISKKRIIYKLNIDEKLKYKEKIGANFRNVYNLKLALYDKLSTNTLDNPLLEDKILKRLKGRYKNPILHNSKTIKEFLFLYKRPYLQDREFTQWKNIELLPTNKNFTIKEALSFLLNNRKEKSLKKAVLIDYQKQQSLTNKYNPIQAYVFSRVVEDVNILKELLALDIKAHIENIAYSRHSFNIYNENYVYKTFYNYTLYIKKRVINEVAFKKHFENLSKKDNYILSDLVEILWKIGFDERLFPKLNFDELFNGLLLFLKNQTTSISKVRSNEDYWYPKTIKNACVEIDSYSVRVPKNNKELLEWGEVLDNCLSGYNSWIYCKTTLVFGFFKGNTLYFVVEISNGAIVQSSYKNNKELKEADKKIVDIWYEKYDVGHNSVYIL